MRKEQKRPETEQRRDDLSRVQKLAAVLVWLAQFILMVLEIIKLWNEVTG